MGKTVRDGLRKLTGGGRKRTTGRRIRWRKKIASKVFLV